MTGKASRAQVLGFAFEKYHYIEGAFEHMAIAAANATPEMMPHLARHFIEEYNHGDIYRKGLRSLFPDDTRPAGAAAAQHARAGELPLRVGRAQLVRLLRGQRAPADDREHRRREGLELDRRLLRGDAQALPVHRQGHRLVHRAHQRRSEAGARERLPRDVPEHPAARRARRWTTPSTSSARWPSTSISSWTGSTRSTPAFRPSRALRPICFPSRPRACPSGRPATERPSSVVSGSSAAARSSRPRTSGGSSTASGTWRTGAAPTACSRSSRRCTLRRSPVSTRRSWPTGCSSCCSVTSSGACWPSTASIPSRARSAGTAWRCTGTTPARSAPFAKSNYPGLGHRDAIFDDEMAVAADYAKAYVKMGFQPALLRVTTLEEAAPDIDWRNSMEDLSVLSERIQAFYAYAFAHRPMIARYDDVPGARWTWLAEAVPADRPALTFYRGTTRVGRLDIRRALRRGRRLRAPVAGRARRAERRSGRRAGRRIAWRCRRCFLPPCSSARLSSR